MMSRRTVGASDLSAVQDRIMRAHYPQLARETTRNSVVEEPRDEPDIQQSSEAPDFDDTISPVHEEESPEDVLASVCASLNQGRITRRETFPPAATSIVAPHPHPSPARARTYTDPTPSSVHADGKWQPRHPNSRDRQLRYARRCMPTLTFETPRQRDIIMKKGERWKINWNEWKLEPYIPTPPAYEKGDHANAAENTSSVPSAVTEDQMLASGGLGDNTTIMRKNHGSQRRHSDWRIGRPNLVRQKRQGLRMFYRLNLFCLS